MNTKITTLVVATILCCFNSLFSANTTWTWDGTFDSDWTNKNNWVTTDGDAGVGSADTVVINASSIHYPFLNAAAVAGTFIQNGGWFFSNGNTFTVTNNITVNNGNFYADASTITAININLNGGVIAIQGGSIDISNSVTIDGGYFFIYYNQDAVIPNDISLVSGTLDLNNRDLLVNGQYSYYGGALINAGTVNINDMVVDFPGFQTLDHTLNILNSLQFIDGIINSSSTDMVIFDFDASASGASNTSHISGPVRRLVAASGNTTFEFPVGNDSVFAPIEISDFAQSRVEDFFTAQYFMGNAPYNHASKDFTIDHLSTAEYWILDRGATAGTPDTDVKVRLSFDENTRSGVVDVASELRISRWDGSAWKDHGTADATGNNATGTFRSSSRITSFSPFTIGSNTSGNPLPVSLLNFQALALDKEVKVIWSTTSEINNDFFTVQKSIDGKNWSVIGIVDGIENSVSLSNYSLIDRVPVNGLQYYRLIQTDLNGESSVSHIVSVSFLSGTLPYTVALFPNPADNTVNVRLSESASDASIMLFNSMGMKVMELNNQSGSSFVLDMTGFQRGVYTLEVHHENGVSITKILKN